jgi:hypothetical protein
MNCRYVLYPQLRLLLTVISIDYRFLFHISCTASDQVTWHHSDSISFYPTLHRHPVSPFLLHISFLLTLSNFLIFLYCFLLFHSQWYIISPLLLRQHDFTSSNYIYTSPCLQFLSHLSARFGEMLFYTASP